MSLHHQEENDFERNEVVNNISSADYSRQSQSRLALQTVNIHHIRTSAEVKSRI